MYQKSKAIILDLDGTLLRSDKSVSERTLKALEECKEAGILVIVATARFWFKAEKYLELIKPDYAILADGTQIYHKGEMIRGFAMTEQAVNGVIQALMHQGPNAEFVVGVGKELLCSAAGISEKWRKSYAFEEDMKQPVYKIAAVLESADMAESLAEDYDCRLYSYRDENLYGFTDKESGKYQAVKALGEFLGIDLQDMVAFGDDENDYEILQNCGVGVAVANAIPQILKGADEVTDSNDEDGVANYLERYCLREELVPFWEETYQNMDTITFSENPNATIKEFEHLFDKDWNILEVGCGEGRNVLYLAKQGYTEVDAFDISENGIKKLRKKCEIQGVRLNAYVDDLTKCRLQKNYDLVMSFGTLHFVGREDWKRFLVHAKEHTNIGGIHIMQIFTDVVPASADIAPFAIGLAKDEEIRGLYEDWEILQFKSYVFEDEHPNVPKHLHASNKIVARKLR